MITLNDLLVIGLCLLSIVMVLRLLGVKRVPWLAFAVFLLFSLLIAIATWVYWEWRQMQDHPRYRSEWSDGELQDLNGKPLDPKSFQGPYEEQR